MASPACQRSIGLRLAHAAARGTSWIGVIDNGEGSREKADQWRLACMSQATVVTAGRSRGGPQARSAWSFRGHQGRPQSLLALFAGKVAVKIRINTTIRKQKVPGVAAVAPEAATRVT